MSQPDEPSMLDDLIAQEKQQKEIDEQLAEECAFLKGEILLIRGGFFKVHGHVGKRLYLDFQAFAKDVIKRPS